jgi:hypothetical protein
MRSRHLDQTGITIYVDEGRGPYRSRAKRLLRCKNFD